MIFMKFDRILLMDSCICVNIACYFREIRGFPEPETFQVLCERITIESSSLLDSN